MVALLRADYEQVVSRDPVRGAERLLGSPDFGDMAASVYLSGADTTGRRLNLPRPDHVASPTELGVAIGLLLSGPPKLHHPWVIDGEVDAEFESQDAVDVISRMIPIE